MIVGTALLSLAALVGVQSMSQDGSALPPTSEAAIVSGGKACLGATTDPAGQDARLAGWKDLARQDVPNGVNTQGRVATRDNVMLVVKTGIDGGCVIQARGNAAFDKARFLADMSKVTGVPIDGTKPVNLPSGELIIVQVGGGGGATFVQLVVANQNGKQIKRHSQGN